MILLTELIVFLAMIVPSRNLLRSKKAGISTYIVVILVNLHDQNALHFMSKIGVNTGKLSTGDLISRG